MNGDSRGKWEGDTLVVDTTNFTANSGSQGSDENLHMIERFTRTAADTVEYQVTLEDPTVWTKPWTFMIPLKFTTDKILRVRLPRREHGALRRAGRGSCTGARGSGRSHGQREMRQAAPSGC